MSICLSRPRQKISPYSVFIYSIVLPWYSYFCAMPHYYKHSVYYSSVNFNVDGLHDKDSDLFLINIEYYL